MMLRYSVRVMTLLPFSLRLNIGVGVIVLFKRAQNGFFF